jgi:hypothetical protein
MAPCSLVDCMAYDTIDNNLHIRRREIFRSHKLTPCFHGTQTSIIVSPKRLLLHLVLTQQNPNHAVMDYCFKIRLNITVPRSLRSVEVSSFSILYACVTFPIHFICPDHIIILDLIMLAVYYENYKLWRSSLCILLYFLCSEYFPRHFPYLKNQ